MHACDKYEIKAGWERATHLLLKLLQAQTVIALLVPARQHAKQRERRAVSSGIIRVCISIFDGFLVVVVSFSAIRR